MSSFVDEHRSEEGAVRGRPQCLESETDEDDGYYDDDDGEDKKPLPVDLSSRSQGGPFCAQLAQHINIPDREITGALRETCRGRAAARELARKASLTRKL